MSTAIVILCWCVRVVKSIFIDTHATHQVDRERGPNHGLLLSSIRFEGDYSTAHFDCTRNRDMVRLIRGGNEF
jgi:hypothetical protein